MQGPQYTVDIVMCIDVTSSMGKLLDLVKTHAQKFHHDVSNTLQSKDKLINDLRVKVIAFRDFYCDREDSLLESRFFSLPADGADFSRFVSGLEPRGGGDLPETSLEALALAMKSDWNAAGDKRRQIIVLWTDDAAHPLDKDAGSKPSHYPKDLPKNFDELTDLWDGQGPMQRSAKRLIIYAPEMAPWSDMYNHWENVMHYPSRAGEGMADADYEQIVDAIANSV
jgi:hypothetical protein